MSKRKHKKQHDTTNKKPKRNLEQFEEYFVEYCDFCGEQLSIIKYRHKTSTKREAVYATCFNDNFKNLGCRCERYAIEVLFIEHFF